MSAHDEQCTTTMKEETLGQNEKLFRALIEHSSDLIVLVDAEGIITYVSPSVRRILGYSPEEVLGKHAFTMVHPGDLPIVQDALDDLRQSPGKAGQAEYRLCCREGGVRWFEATTTNLLAEPGVAAIVGNFHDITERKGAEEERTYLLAREQNALSLVQAERQRLYDLFMQAPAIIGITRGPRHIIELVNPCCLQILGNRSAADFIGKPCAEVMPELVGQGLIAIMDQVYRSGETYLGNNVPVFLDVQGRGRLEEHIFNFVYQPSRNVGGKIEGILIHGFEVTEQVHSCKALDQFFTLSLDMLCIIDFNGYFQKVNPAFEKILGYAPAELCAHPVSYWLHAEDKERTTNEMQKLKNGVPTRYFENRYRTKDGTYKWLAWTAIPSLEDQVMYAVARDITKQKREDQLKDEFIGMASHELKTPITSLKGFNQILLRRLNKQEDLLSVEYLLKMEKQVNRLAKVVNDLLDISKIQTGKLNYQEEHFDLSQLVQEIVEIFQASTFSHWLLIEEAMNTPVVGDRDRLGQVFINLLTNAIKYSPQADKVCIRVVRDQKQGVVSVQDFGKGIAKEHHDKVFERFYQISSPGEQPFSGLGIGLYLSREIIRRHAGKIWVKSSKGSGSTFFFSLPLSEEAPGSV
ncbi:PAS domain S-box protein [Ktedonosporobacter rubrisoli]|uniref:histidine kinase n=1 Tax=Ktedonosporobacter rubrisoli TaxID=2509675 RepID=A0A4P6K0Q6_KTERU|nr:PAS domain S-box protein [Ktedonosporobacter rubrisoli]QBD81768.1 PAS domain S-box protein [Ktedonosporobacter rubrisoli]